MKKTIEQRYMVTAINSKENGIAVSFVPMLSVASTPKTDEEIVATKIVKGAVSAMASIMPSMPFPYQVAYGIVLTPQEYTDLKVMVGDVLLLKITKLQAQ